MTGGPANQQGDVVPFTRTGVECPEGAEAFIAAGDAHTDDVVVECPPQEYYEALAGELNHVRAEQAKARLLSLYDQTLVPGTAKGSSGDKSVYDMTFNGAHPGARPLRGQQLADHRAALDVRQRILQAEIDAFFEARERYNDATTKAAPETAAV